MYLRRCYRSKDGKRHGYWALVESHRSSRGPRQRVVAYLGEMDAAGRLGIHQQAAGAAAVAQRGLFRDVAPQWVEVDLKRIAVERKRKFGAPWLGLRLSRQLGLVDFLEQTIDQSQLPAEPQPQPRSTELPFSFHRDPLQIDFHPLRCDVAEQSPLSNRSRTRGLLVNAQAPGCIHLPKIGHHALSRAARRTMTLDQRPVAMTLAILAAIAATQVHAPILRIATALSRGLVFTTNPFTHTTQPASRTHAANGNVRKSQGSNRLENVLKKSSTRCKLRKLG